MSNIINRKMLHIGKSFISYLCFNVHIFDYIGIFWLNLSKVRWGLGGGWVRSVSNEIIHCGDAQRKESSWKN